MLGKILDRFRKKPKPISPVGRLHISYEPCRDGDADPGEVVWTWVPYEDDTDHRSRRYGR